MKLRFLALVACVLLPFQAVNADIASDLAAGLDMQTVLQNAVDQGMSIEDAVAEAVGLNPENAGDIVAAANSIAPGSSEAIAAAAIAAGADPAVVTAATAAGPAAGPGVGGRGLGTVAPASSTGGGTASPG